MSKSHEQMFNYALGKALKKVNHRYSQENLVYSEQLEIAYKNGNYIRPDILIDDKETPNIIIECSYKACDAEGDARNRLDAKYPHKDGTPINTTFAVFIDQKFRDSKTTDEIKEELLKNHLLQYAIYQQIKDEKKETLTVFRWPEKGFVRSTIFDLSFLIPSVATPKENLLQISETIANQVKEAARCLSRSFSIEQEKQISKKVFQKSPLSGMRTAMVTWLNALLLQQLLYSNDRKNVPPLHSTENKEYNGYLQLEHWDTIMDINWIKVFEPARNTLSKALQKSPFESAEALKLLIKSVHQITSTRLGSGIDIGAELFPRLSDDRKETAAFYTQAPSAEFLATLTIEENDLSEKEWADPDLMKKHQLVDMACGTGTLLRAAYRRILNLHEKHHKDTWDRKKMHEDAMEKGIVGIDISAIATHLTVTSLSAMCSTVDYANNRIFSVKVGGDVGYVGSLELFSSEFLTQILNKTTKTSQDDEKDTFFNVKDGSVQWVIMNPPYSRTDGKKGAFDVSGFSKEERQRCQKRWGTLIAKKPVNKVAGMAASFLVLAKMKCKPNGRIGFVLPLTAAFAQSWQETRAMVEKCFDDIIVVAISGGKALKGKAISADTNMEEMFLIARKWGVNVCYV